MATRFVELNEAAKMLGLTSDQLVEMRSKGDIHGYRDGASWKFKLEEIERVSEELGTAPPAADSDLDDDADGSILVSEEELGHSGEGTSSTIIGKSSEASQAESDLRLTPGVDSDVSLVPASPDTDLTLDAGPEAESDVTLVPGVGTDSDVALVPDPGSDGELGESSDSQMDLQSASTGGTGRLEGIDSSDMSIGSSDVDVTFDSELALSDDDDVVLGGSGVESDLTLGAADSGINLSSPSDSGLSLEAESGINLQSPTDSGLSLEEEGAGGSSISSLELPEDEEVIALDEEPGAAGPAKKDEEFLLSPSEDMFGDESDSGSQVIALEESGAFDQDPAAMMQPAGDALLEETAGLEEQLDSIGVGTGTAAQPMPVPGYMAAEMPEAPYTIWNVIGLLLIVMFLCLSGILMTDVVQNMWAWEESRDVSTSISEGITSAIFGK